MPIFNQDNFWRDSRNAEDIDKLLKLERLDSVEREKYLIDALKAALKEQSRKNADELEAATLTPFSNRADLAEKILYLSGGNPSAQLLGYNEPLSKIDKASIKSDVKELLNIAMGRDELTLMYSSTVAKGLLEQWYHNSKNGHPEYLEALNEAFNDDIKRQLITLIEEDAISLDNIDKGALNDFARKQKDLILEPKKNEFKGNALLGTEELEQEEIALRSRLDTESKKHLIIRSRKTDAQIQMNLLLESHKNWATRTTQEKIRQISNEKVKDLLDPNGKLHYPSVDIFGESLDLMDENGRAKDTLLKFKRGYFGGPSVVFPKADVEEDVYNMAALKCKFEGIMKPHIHCTFKDPATAIRFMKFTVDALINAGYDIDDISVDRNIREAFENYKSERLISNQGMIREATGEEPEPLPEPFTQTEIDAQNQLLREQRNAEINAPIQKVREALDNQEQNVQLRDLPMQTIKDVLERAHLLKEDPLSWSEMQEKEGLNPFSRDTAEVVMREIGKVLDGFDPESATFDTEKMNKRGKQARLLRDLGPQVLTSAFGIERFQRCMPQIVAKIKSDEGLPFDNPYVKPSAAHNARQSGEFSHDTQAEDMQPLSQNEPFVQGDEFSNSVEQHGATESELSSPPEGPPLSDYTLPPEQVENTYADEYDIAAFHAELNDSHIGLDSTQGPIDLGSAQEPIEVVHKLFPHREPKLNVGGVLLSQDYAEDWRNIAAKLHQDKVAHPEKWPHQSSLTMLSSSEIKLLVSMDHHDWGKLDRSDFISMQEKKIIKEMSQNLHSLLTDIKNPKVWNKDPVSQLEIRLLQDLPESMHPESLKIRAKRGETALHVEVPPPPRPTPPRPK